MQLWLSHWHCIVPLVAIGFGMLLMRKKPTSTEDTEYTNTNRIAPEEQNSNQNGGFFL